MVTTPFGWCFHNFIGKVTDSEKTKLECRQFQWQHIAFQKESLQGKGLCWVKKIAIPFWEMQNITASTQFLTKISKEKILIKIRFN